MVRSHLEDLRDNFKGYPKETTDFDYEKNLGTALNNAVWDIEHGTVLKLTEDKEVSHALLGFKKLTKTEIEAIYGSKPIFK